MNDINQNILNDEKVIEELHEKLGDYEAKIKICGEKKKELQNTLSDLDKKTGIDDISDMDSKRVHPHPKHHNANSRRNIHARHNNSRHWHINYRNQRSSNI